MECGSFVQRWSETQYGAKGIRPGTFTLSQSYLLKECIFVLGWLEKVDLHDSGEYLWHPTVLVQRGVLDGDSAPDVGCL